MDRYISQGIQPGLQSSVLLFRSSASQKFQLDHPADKNLFRFQKWATRERTSGWPSFLKAQTQAEVSIYQSCHRRWSCCPETPARGFRAKMASSPFPSSRRLRGSSGASWRNGREASLHRPLPPVSQGAKGAKGDFPAAGWTAAGKLAPASRLIKKV